MIIHITRFVVALIFFAGAMLKFFNPHPFMRLFYELGFGEWLINITLGFTILTELGVSYFLIFKKQTGIPIAFVYLAVLTLALMILWVSGVDVDCGCFGGFIQSQIGPVKLLQNTAILFMLGISWYSLKTEKAHLSEA